MEDGQADHTTNKLEVVQVLRVHAGVRINLQGIIIVGGVFEETVEGVKHFMREEEEEFTAEISNQPVITLKKKKERTEKDHHSQDHLRHQT